MRNALLLSLLVAAVAGAQSAGNWTVQIPQTYPNPREGHAMAEDAAHAEVVMFGGFGGDPSYTGGNEISDTWVWNGSNWSQRSPQTHPAPREGAAMAYDLAHSQVVLFGGYLGSYKPELADTWVWDGSNWVQKSPQTSPPARTYHAMAYDVAHGQVVLFGGVVSSKDGNAAVGDTWVWDSSNWSQKSPQISPPARYGHAMAYDAAHHQIVLFGGVQGYYDRLGDTWVWDGSNWSQKSPQISPPARSGTAMVYDAAHAQIVLFGGSRAAYMEMELADTWVWDGSNWSQKSPQTSPLPRENHAMAYDGVHGQIVLFGGFYGPQRTGDTWIWQGATLAPPTPSITGVVSASAFGGFSAVAPGSWIEIYGSNLAPGTRTWAAADFNGSNAPASLDGVTVNIGGQKAFVEYISVTPGQVNAQLPSGIPAGGQLPITIGNGNGTSAPFNVTVNNTQAGLLAPAPFQIRGKQYVVALLSDAVTYVLPAGSIPGVASRPAKPGETIVFYGIGFGPVMPNIDAGQIVTKTNQLSQSLQILFGQTPAQLSYYGLAPGFVGLYQFDVVVPAVADSDLVPLTFNLGSVPSTQMLYTAVHQ